MIATLRVTEVVHIVDNMDIKNYISNLKDKQNKKPKSALHQLTDEVYDYFGKPKIIIIRGRTVKGWVWIYKRLEEHGVQFCREKLIELQKSDYPKILPYYMAIIDKTETIWETRPVDKSTSVPLVNIENA